MYYGCHELCHAFSNCLEHCSVIAMPRCLTYLVKMLQMHNHIVFKCEATPGGNYTYYIYTTHYHFIFHNRMSTVRKMQQQQKGIVHKFITSHRNNVNKSGYTNILLFISQTDNFMSFSNFIYSKNIRARNGWKLLVAQAAVRPK